MLLAIDVGNSNTSVGLFDKDKTLRFLAQRYLSVIQSDKSQSRFVPTQQIRRDKFCCTTAFFLLPSCGRLTFYFSFMCKKYYANRQKDSKYEQRNNTAAYCSSNRIIIV